MPPKPPLGPFIPVHSLRAIARGIIWLFHVKIRVRSSTLPSAVSSGRTELRPKGGPGFGSPQRGEVYRAKT
jgi:hypothetical protein